MISYQGLVFVGAAVASALALLLSARALRRCSQLQTWNKKRSTPAVAKSGRIASGVPARKG